MTPLRSRARALGLLAPLAGAALLGGCRVGPDFRRPPPPAVSGYLPPGEAVPAALPGQSLAAGALVPPRWWRLYGSSRLDALVEEGLTRNSDLAAAEAALEAARQTALAARGALLPTVGLDAAGSRNKSSDYLAPPLADNSFRYGLATAQVQVAYVLDPFGGARRTLEGQIAQAEAQRFQTEGVRLTLASNIVAAAVASASLTDQIRSQKDLIASTRRLLDLELAQARAGALAGADVLAQETALAQAEQALPPLERALAIQAHLLADLTGRAPAEAETQAFSLADLTLPRSVPLSCPSAVVDRRPDVRAAEASLHAASAAVGVALAARLPSFTLSAAYGGQAPGLSTLFDQTNRFWSLGFDAAQPVFQGGQLRRREAAARAQLRQARALYRSAVLTALQNVADALKALETDAAAERAAVRSEGVARRALDAAAARLRLGQTDATGALLAEQALDTAVLARVQATAARLADTAALFQALGGGPSEGDPTRPC